MTKYYLSTPFCETFTSREEAAGTIADLFCDQASERGTDARRAFCAIYNGGEELEWLLEQLHDLAHDVDPDEAEKILALIADICRFDGERRPA